MQYYSREKRGLKTLSVLSFIAMVIVHVLAMMDMIGANRPDEILRKYDNLMMPHPYVAVLWILVGFFLLYFVIFQSGKPGYGAKKDAMEIITPLFIGMCILSALWIVVWCLDILWLTLPIILLLCVLLNIAYFKLERIEPYLYNDERKGMIYPISFFLAFAMNLMVLNMVFFVKSTGWNFFGVPRPILAIIVILIILIINSTYITLRRNFFFSFVSFVILVGIVVARYLEGDIMPVGYLSAVAALFILILSAGNKRKNINKG